MLKLILTDYISNNLFIPHIYIQIRFQMFFYCHLENKNNYSHFKRSFNLYILLSCFHALMHLFGPKEVPPVINLSFVIIICHSDLFSNPFSVALYFFKTFPVSDVVHCRVLHLCLKSHTL